MFEVRSRTLLCGDLFTQPGDGARPPVTSTQILEESEAFRRRHLSAEQHELQRLGAADQPGHALGTSEAGDDPEVGLGLSHPRGVLEQAQVAGHRDLAAAA